MIKPPTTSTFFPYTTLFRSADVDPSGEYLVGNGKLSADMSVYSFSQIMQAIEEKNFDGDFDGIPIINYEAGLHGIVQKPGLGDRKSTRLNSSHVRTSYAVFC